MHVSDNYADRVCRVSLYYISAQFQRWIDNLKTLYLSQGSRLMGFFTCTTVQVRNPLAQSHFLFTPIQIVLFISG